MKKVLLVLAVALIPSLVTAATLTGTVKFSGTAPAMKPIAMSADPVCQGAHSKPVLAETLVLGTGNTMANVFVRVKSGLAAKSHPVPTTPVVLDQKGCQYMPHVAGIRVGQNLLIKNSDQTLHNVHAMPKANQEFNLAMPKTRKEATKTFTKSEVMVPLKCDVHPWMAGYLGVMEHPFFAVTATNGAFKIDGLDAGTYEVEAWHEKLGTQVQKITVAATDSKAVDFTFSKPN